MITHGYHPARLPKSESRDPSDDQVERAVVGLARACFVPWITAMHPAGQHRATIILPGIV